MNAEVLNARALTMRVGAVLAAFVLAFSLLVVAPPAHASTLSWSNTRFSGDEVIATTKTRVETEGGNAATADICTEAQKKRRHYRMGVDNHQSLFRSLSGHASLRC